MCAQGWERLRDWTRWGQPQTHLLPAPWGPRALLCFDHQLKEIKEAKGQTPSAFSPQESEIMK